jgi:hypothetical protein
VKGHGLRGSIVCCYCREWFKAQARAAGHAVVMLKQMEQTKGEGRELIGPRFHLHVGTLQLRLNTVATMCTSPPIRIIWIYY